MPLRPELYRRLKDKFRHIVIANEGHEMAYRYEGGELKVLQQGETYRVNCPYCRDTRKRLFINHRWGLRDEVTGNRLLWLIHCFNESCLKNCPERRRALYEEIFDPTESCTAADEVEQGSWEDMPTGEPYLPGRLVPICNIVKHHISAQYLLSRNFDLDYLSRHFHVSWCDDSLTEGSIANNRIIVPVFYEGKLVGWQARYIGEPPSKFVPKYYSMPGWKKGRYLYNYDNAIQFNYVIVCEGPTDVWRVGLDAVCLFGKTPTFAQGALLCNNWKTHFLMLDNDVSDAEIKRAQQRIDPHGLAKIIVVKLPQGQDPGSMNPEYMHALISAAAWNEGVTLTVRS